MSQERDDHFRASSLLQEPQRQMCSLRVEPEAFLGTCSGLCGPLLIYGLYSIVYSTIKLLVLSIELVRSGSSRCLKRLDPSCMKIDREVCSSDLTGLRTHPLDPNYPNLRRHHFNLLSFNVPLLDKDNPQHAQTRRDQRRSEGPHDGGVVLELDLSQ